MSSPVPAPPWWRRQLAYWQILALAFVITFIMTFVTIKPLSGAAISEWLLRSVAIGLGFCIGEALRRRFA
jgi:hypothetical protein